MRHSNHVQVVRGNFDPLTKNSHPYHGDSGSGPANVFLLENRTKWLFIRLRCLYGNITEAYSYIEQPAVIAVVGLKSRDMVTLKQAFVCAPTLDNKTVQQLSFMYNISVIKSNGARMSQQQLRGHTLCRRLRK